MHLDEEQVQRLLHGELAPQAATAAREHLASCTACAGRLADARRDEDEVDALLRHVDDPAPRVDAREMVARARARDAGWRRWAAGILLTMGIAAAAYAAPGSPLRVWAETALQRVGRGGARSLVAPSAQQLPDRPAAGIAVPPTQGLVILFMVHQAEGDARVSLTDSAMVVVRAPIGAATFTSDVDRLLIDNRGSSATFEIEIPRTAPRVEIRVAGDPIFRKDGARVTSRGSPQPGSSYVVPLTPSRP